MQNIDLTKKTGLYKTWKFIITYKMCKETFGDIEIEKNKYYHHKSPILLKDIDIEKVLVSNKISLGEKIYL